MARKVVRIIARGNQRWLFRFLMRNPAVSRVRFPLSGLPNNCPATDTSAHRPLYVKLTPNRPTSGWPVIRVALRLRSCPQDKLTG